MFRLVHVRTGSASGLTVWFEGEELGQSLLVVHGRVPLFPGIEDLRAFAASPLPEGAELADEIDADPEGAERALAAQPLAVDLEVLGHLGETTFRGLDAVAALDAFEVASAIAAATDDRLAQSLLAGGGRLARARAHLEAAVDRMPVAGTLVPMGDIAGRLVELLADDVVVLDAAGLATAMSDEQRSGGRSRAIRERWNQAAGGRLAGIPARYLLVAGTAAALVALARLWQLTTIDLATAPLASIAIVVLTAVEAALIVLFPLALLAGAHDAATTNRPLLAGATIGAVHEVANAAWGPLLQPSLRMLLLSDSGLSGLSGDFGSGPIQAYTDWTSAVLLGMRIVGIAGAVLLAVGFARGAARWRGVTLLVALGASGSLEVVSLLHVLDLEFTATWWTGLALASDACLLVALAVQAALATSAAFGGRDPRAPWRLAAAGASLRTLDPAATVVWTTRLSLGVLDIVPQALLAACAFTGAACLLMAAVRGLGVTPEPASGQPPPVDDPSSVGERVSAGL